MSIKIYQINKIAENIAFSCCAIIMDMKYTKANSKAWDWEAEHGSGWARIVDEEQIRKARNGHPEISVTVNKAVPETWLLPLKGKHVLSLGGGGGQQTPTLAAFGCDTESADISRVMIERDNEALRRYNLEAKTHIMDMNDLSAFPESSFDAVISPVSMNFIEDISKVFGEVYRILRPNGTFIFGIANPAIYMFDDEKLAQGKMKVKYTLPFADPVSLSRKELKKRLKRNDTIEYSHTLESIIGGLTAKGFVINGFYSDGSDFEPIDSFLHDCYLAFRAIRIDNR